MTQTARTPPVSLHRAVRQIATQPDLLAVVYQPIVDLQEATVVGYEALARFPGPPALPPDHWFAAAELAGVAETLEARVVEHCLSARRSLPADCFLTINVSPHLLTRPALADLLLSHDDLSLIVLELTEHVPVHDPGPLLALLSALRSRGALVALDDAGAGYSGLQQLSVVRPELVKLDRALVTDIHRDEVKLALAQLMGEFAGRIDAWLLAEGVERWDELAALIQIGVPLAQGYLLARPGPPWADLEPGTRHRLQRAVGRSQLVEQVASLVEQVPVDGEEPDSTRAGQVLLRLDTYRRPVGLLLPLLRDEDPPGRHRSAEVSLKVLASAGVVEVARRAVARPPASRFDPVICVDRGGQAVGVVRMERLLLRLTELK